MADHTSSQPEYSPQPQPQQLQQLQPQAQQPQQLQSQPQAQQPQQVPQQLPTDEKRRVHHTYIWLGGIRIALSLGIAFFVMLAPYFSTGDLPLFSNGTSFVRSAIMFVLLAGAFVLVVAITIGWTALTYRYLSYEIGTKEFSLYSGIFNKKRVHVPYQKIQSVNQRATFIQRVFGVCTVHIDTAGGSTNKAVVVPYLQNSEAERLRAEVFARKQMLLVGQDVAQLHVSQGGAATYQQMGQGSNLLDAPAEIIADVRGVFGGAYYDTGAVSYEHGLSNKELIFTGLSNNTGVVIMLFVALSSIGGIVGPLLESSFGQQIYNEGATFINRVFAGNMILSIVIFSIVALLFFWLLSIIGACISYGGFRATRRQNRIEVEHGLLQHRFHGVDIDRVQSVIIKQSFIRRLIGYCELSLGKIDAMSENSQERQQGIAHQGLIVHPFVKMSKVPEILAGLIPEFADMPTEIKKLPPVALRRALVRQCFLFGSGFWIAVVAAGVQVSANLFVPSGANSSVAFAALFNINTICPIVYGVCVALALIEGINAVLWFKSSSFAYNDRFMQISNGGFSRESVSFPRKKIQFGYTKANPFQRASHLATIKVRTAAGVGGTTMKLLDTREIDAEQWLDWVRPGRGMVQQHLS